jgi:hypothetical protein
MRYILTILCLLSITGSRAQRIPSLGVNRIRINEAEKSILLEVESVERTTKADPALTYYWYNSGVVHTTRGGFSGKLLNGRYTEFYLNKNLREQGIFKEGLKDGPWKQWAENGILIKLETWKEGTLNGPFTLYSTQGSVFKDGTYYKGLLDGRLKEYSSADSLVIRYYKRGKLLVRKPSFLQRINIFKGTKIADSTTKKTGPNPATLPTH